MKERPILFSAPMVIALLDGTKTQTRRVLKQATGPSLSVDCEDCIAELSWLHGDGPGYDVHETVKRVPCPYGVPGDRLWVRETGWECPDRAWRPWPYAYDADAPFGVGAANEAYREEGWKRRPSIFMPRWASRITLEVTGVRVERLQGISEADAVAEGVEPIATHDRPGAIATCYGAYRLLWESINGAGSWDANPWVWVIEFRRL